MPNFSLAFLLQIIRREREDDWRGEENHYRKGRKGIRKGRKESLRRFSLRPLRYFFADFAVSSLPSTVT